MNHGVLFHKTFIEILLVHAIDHAETLTEETVISEVSPLLAAALQKHHTKLHLRRKNITGRKAL